jgi:hypothetical protein
MHAHKWADITAMQDGVSCRIRWLCLLCGMTKTVSAIIPSGMNDVICAAADPRLTLDDVAEVATDRVMGAK